MTIWALSPLVLYLDPTLFGMFTPWTSPADFHAPGGEDLACSRNRRLLFRTVHLFFIRDVETGLVWMTKNPDRPVQRPQALLQGAALSDER